MNLFAERGFDEVTMDDVAVASGASRRTVYRHFPTKGDLVFERPRGWVRHFDEVVAAGPADEAGLTRCLRALRSVAQLIDDTDEAVFVGFQVYLQTPSLRGSHARLDDEVFARISALAQADLPDDANKITNSAIIAGALVGTLNGVLTAWALQWPDQPMTTLMGHALDRLSPVFAADPAQGFDAPQSTTRTEQR